MMAPKKSDSTSTKRKAKDDVSEEEGSEDEAKATWLENANKLTIVLKDENGEELESFTLKPNATQKSMGWTGNKQNISIDTPEGTGHSSVTVGMSVNLNIKLPKSSGGDKKSKLTASSSSSKKKKKADTSSDEE